MSMRRRTAIFISGRGSNMTSLIEAARVPEFPAEIALVLSNRPDAPGLATAKARGIASAAVDHKIYAGREAFEASLQQVLEINRIEFICLAGFMRLLTPAFTTHWAGRMLNIHPSLLPKYKGLHTHERALEAGDSHAGASVHLVTPELDDGEVLGQAQVAILPGDTPHSLAARVLIAEHQLYSRVLSEFVSRPYRADWLLGKINELALALPEAQARGSHGSPGWTVGDGKFFAHFSDRHHGEAEIAVLVKTGGQDELAALIERDPETYYRPAYYGASGWVGIVLNRPGVDWQHVSDWLARSWRAVAPRKLTKLLDIADEF